MNFLLLQGNATPFFQELAQALATAGHDVRQIAFNGGDWLFSSRPTCFHGRPRNWPGFFDNVVRRDRPDAVILFGDCRPMHRAAIEYLQAHDIDVWVFEEGYLRPGWITLEREGVNGFSQLPSDPATIMARAPDDHRRIHYDPKPDFVRRAFYDISYHVARMLFMPVFPFARFHALVGPFREYAGWVRDWMMAWRLADPQVIPCTPFMLLPMQMEGDYQLRMHSPFDGMGQVLQTALKSFAANAPAEMKLVIRRHPLDPRLTDWGKLIATQAAELGIEDRVSYMCTGSLDSVLHGCSGIVTVNSTVGLLALRAGHPVKTLGYAIYDVHGLTFQGELDQFWRAAEPPDPILLDAFCRLLEQEVLVEGDFFTPTGRKLAVTGTLQRLTSVYASKRARQDFRISTVSSN